MQGLPRVRLDRVNLVAAFGINWRTVAETLDAMRMARDAGFGWVEFDWFDREYLPRIRSGNMREHCAGILNHGGCIHRFALEARNLHIGFGIRPLTRYVIDESMGTAGMIRVPLDCVDDAGYWVALSRSAHHPLVLYETTATWPTPTAGRVPIFVAPDWPAEDKRYEPFFTMLSPEHRLGIAFHAKRKELFQAAIVACAPMVIQPVAPDTYANAPDQAVAVKVSTAAEWIAELRVDDALVEEP